MSDFRRSQDYRWTVHYTQKLVRSAKELLASVEKLESKVYSAQSPDGMEDILAILEEVKRLHDQVNNQRSNASWHTHLATKYVDRPVVPPPSGWPVQ